MNPFIARKAEFKLQTTPWPNLFVKDYPEDEHTRMILIQRLNFIQDKDTYSLIDPMVAEGIKYKLRRIDAKILNDKLKLKKTYERNRRKSYC